MKALVVIALSLASFTAHADRRIQIQFHPRMPAHTVDIAGFSASQEDTIQSALVYLQQRIWEIYNGENNGNHDSAFTRCAAKYSTKDWERWSNDQPYDRNRLNNGYWTYVDIVMGLQNNLQKGLPIQITSFYENSNVVGRANIGVHGSQTAVLMPLSITLNSFNFGNGTMQVNDWAGTIYHELLHNLGWQHPTGYEGSVIKEAGLCIARGNTDKAFGLTGDVGYGMVD